MVELLESVGLPARPGSDLKSVSLCLPETHMGPGTSGQVDTFQWFWPEFSEMTDPRVASAPDSNFTVSRQNRVG